MERSFRRDIAALDEIFDFVEGFVADEKLGGTISFATKLAVEELFTNLVRHNTGGRATVEISLAIDRGRLVVSLKDFDVAPVAAPPGRVERDLPLERREVGGLGIPLVRSLFDALTYDYRDGTLCVTATKNLEDSHV